MLLAAGALGVLVGLVIGTVGGGGAILALPALVYLLDEGVGQATTASLIVVALAAGLGGSALARRGHVCWSVALRFSAFAAAGSVLGTLAGATVDPRALILAFVPVMLAAAAATWWRAGEQAGGERPCPETQLGHLAVAGLSVGTLTGFFGVGGGFLIVPALTAGLGMSMRRAIASSLVIIAITTLVALAAHLADGVELDAPITAALAGGTAAGALLGTGLGRRLSGPVLARGFAVLVVALAAFLLADVLLLDGPPRG